MDAPPQLFISLIVHEKPEVILDQLRNFRRFAPAAIIVLHISKMMEIPVDLVTQIESLQRVHLNPIRVATTFYSLQGPHHENLRFILGLNPAETDRVAFHASNDLLVRKGVEHYVCSHAAAYFHDGIYFPAADSKILADREFAALRSKAASEVLIFSQVEGSFYQVQHLRRAFDLIEEVGMDLTQPRPYFAEEIILPTLIHGFLKGTSPSVGIPYILSEGAFIAKYFEIAGKLFGQGIVAKIFSRLLRTIGPIRITPRLVDRIRKGNLGIYENFRQSNGAVRFRTADSYGVKRVPRDIASRLRRHISGLQ